PWERTLDNPISLTFGKFITLQQIPNADFPEHYFNFAAYNELPAKVNAKNPVLTGNLSTSSVHRYKIKGRYRLVMLIRQTCILSINTILPSAQCWTKDHPLEQVIGNPSQSVRTRRHLETDGEMCMFALTVSRIEPKNIKEAMADSAWIESMQEELHQFDRLDVWELVDIPFAKMSSI
ncbi:hypothetical protein Tco_0225439, partial [Tanacetum coccineum]